MDGEFEQKVVNHEMRLYALEQMVVNCIAVSLKALPPDVTREFFDRLATAAAMPTISAPVPGPPIVTRLVADELEAGIGRLLNLVRQLMTGMKVNLN